MSWSQQVAGWPLESGRDLRIKTCVSGKGIFSKSQGLWEEEVLHGKGRGKLLNRSHVGKGNDHHQLIMKSERMRNHDALITYTLELLSSVLYTLRSVPIMQMCFENLRHGSKPLVTMNLVSPIMIPSLTRLVINASCSAYIIFTSQVYALCVIFPASPEFLAARKSNAIKCVTNLGQSILPPWVHPKSTTCRTNTCFTMETSQNIRKGSRSSRNVGLEYQKLTLVNEDMDVKASFE